MKIAAVTITYNRLELTKRTIESFYAHTFVDKHVFVDNGSTDGTAEYLRANYDHILLDQNYGITEAFRVAVEQLTDYDYILKLDNDIETVTDKIIDKMVDFITKEPFHCVSPVDLNLDPNYAPRELQRANKHKYNLSYVTHTGGAFQLIPIEICTKLMKDYVHFKQGDMSIGGFYRENGYSPVYMLDLQMRHVGINQSSKNYIL